MFKKIIIFGLLSYSSLYANFNSLTASEVHILVRQGVPIIDIRRADEWKKYGIIKGSYKLTFFNNKGQYDIGTWMRQFIKIVPNNTKPFILVCAHANRTKVVGRFLYNQLKYKNTNELKGGIMYGWIDKGFKIVK
jgi:rhodanese-related sulfurtransferase